MYCPPPHVSRATATRRPDRSYTMEKLDARRVLRRVRRRATPTAVASSQTEQLLAPVPQQPSALIKVSEYLARLVPG